MKDYFSFNMTRLGHLLRRDMLLHFRAYALGWAGAFAILFVIGLSWAMGGDPDAYHLHGEFFPLFFLVGGSYLTSVVFRELRDPAERTAYLLLPASATEKVLSKWLVSSVGFALISIVLYSVFAVINNLLVDWITGYKMAWFNPFSGGIPKVILMYFGIQMIFLTAAVSFRRFVLIKTIFFLFLFLLFSAMVFFLVIRLGFGHLLESGGILASGKGMRPPVGMMKFIEIQYPDIVGWLYALLVMPSLMLVCIFKLAEKEVK